MIEERIKKKKKEKKWGKGWEVLGFNLINKYFLVFVFIVVKFFFFFVKKNIY